MAPGIFCVWSSSNPDTTPRTDGGEETFNDAITALPGVVRSYHIKQAEEHVIAPPFNHDIPYMTIYHVADAKIYEEKEFKDLEAQWQNNKETTFAPRFYEEIELIEEEGCENMQPEFNDLVAVLTAEAPEASTQFHNFHRDVIVGSVRECPNFVRARLYRQVGETQANDKVSSPVMFLHEYSSDELPWTELVDVGMTQEWQDMLESGLNWQGVFYHVQSLGKKAKDDK
ncbi:hypothetical protein P280DRAFT_545862 [Massarina eburnea CBS 473.64]|uniref:EthD domain-containing protein n=1 Tax=Massarina eburnea CBS 473.64 TaxID=1395130 RepID=A0A6A6SHS8_9PLEO|nr:hypothetical protein P280DRAFT_545862 [Massarina eburnea CBS 473.64]